MDAFGSPSALTNELEQGLGDLVFDGNFGGFVSGIGGGLTTSLSKVSLWR
jgi:hypothetical protein